MRFETSPHTAENCAACEPVEKPWWKDHALWAVCLLAVMLGFGRFWPRVADALWGYLANGSWAIALGLILGGIIDHFIPKEYISIWLTGKRKRTILASAGLGFLASSCSHGCLALSMELYRKGASVSAVLTFLLASPWANLSMTLLILSLMGWKGLLIVVMALAIAVVSGFIFQRLEKRGLVAENPHSIRVGGDFSILLDLKKRFLHRKWTPQTLAGDLRGIARGSLTLSRMMLFWVALGFTFSAVLGTVVPPHWWGRYFGPTLLGLLAALAVATLIEVCSEGTAPIAVELYRQTGALGNAFGFLMGGVVTDFTELSLLWANLGKKAVGWYLLVTLPQVFLWGMALNLLH